MTQKQDIPQEEVVFSPLVVQSVFYAYPRLALSWVGKNKGKWTTLYAPQACRTRLHDYWYRFTRSKRYGTLPPCVSGLPLEEENACLFYYLITNRDDFHVYRKRIFSNLKRLNKLEEKYGITPTTIEFVEADQGGVKLYGVVFKGDKDWQSNLWKISIYSFLTKATCSPRFWRSSGEDFRDYTPLLKKNEKALLSKVKTEFTEHLPDISFHSVHINSGFVSICVGANQKMKELLLGE